MKMGWKHYQTEIGENMNVEDLMDLENWNLKWIICRLDGSQTVSYQPGALFFFGGEGTYPWREKIFYEESMRVCNRAIQNRRRMQRRGKESQ